MFYHDLFISFLPYTLCVHWLYLTQFCIYYPLRVKTCKKQTNKNVIWIMHIPISWAFDVLEQVSLDLSLSSRSCSQTVGFIPDSKAWYYITKGWFDIITDKGLKCGSISTLIVMFLSGGKSILSNAHSLFSLSDINHLLLPLRSG